MGGQVTVAGITDATALGRYILLILDVPTLLALITELGSSGAPVLNGRRWVSVLAHVVAINDSGTDMTKKRSWGPTVIRYLSQQHRYLVADEHPRWWGIGGSLTTPPMSQVTSRQTGGHPCGLRIMK